MPLIISNIVVDIIILSFANMKQETSKQKPHQAAQSRSQIILSYNQHKVISGMLPKNYSLVQRKEFQQYMRVKGKTETQSQTQTKTGRVNNEPGKQSIKIIENQEASQMAIQKSSQQELQQHVQTNPETQDAQQQIVQPTAVAKQMLPSQNANTSSLSKIVSQMISHPSFPILYGARKQIPDIRKQLKHINSMLKGKKYETKDFKEDLGKLFQIYFSQNSQNEQIKTFQQVVLDKITELQLQIAKAKFLEQTKSHLRQRQNEQVEVIVIEQSKSQEEQRRRKDRKQTRSYYSKHKQQYSNQYEMHTPLPVKKGRTSIPQRPHSTNIKLKDIASLGYNMTKLTSKDLQAICISLCKNQYMNSTKAIEYYNINLQKLTAQSFLSLQAFVKNALKAQKHIYHLLIDPQEYDEFVINDE